MSLYQKLQKASSEEDVKDAYIKALGLKEVQKNLIDIQTKEIWFEAKQNAKLSSYAMFTQLMHYVQDALNKGHYVPPFLCVIDTQKAAIMKSEDVIPFLEKKTIKWGKSASSYTQEALDAISAHIGTHFVSFKIETHEEEFINTVKNAIKKGDIIRTPITPDNLKQVFDKWVAMIGQEIEGIKDEEYALLFFADIMHDGTVSTHDNLPAELMHKDGAPVFVLNGKVYKLGNTEGYRQFWAIYHKPPKAEYRNYLLERRDSLIPIDERSFKGAYYTPLNVVDKAYDKLAETLGNNWQKSYIVWDMCCGVGNLEVKHSNPRNIYMSTLDDADVDVMKATKTCVAATRFQYDYLNDDIDDFGNIDYSLTNKIPQGLSQAIAEGKKILILINPPYGETGSGIGKGDKNKKEVEQTKINALMKTQELGYASKELFVQFLVRIAKEIPTATIAMFSKMKYVNAPNFEKFRVEWNSKYLGGFVVHSKAFDGLKGDFPIGFLVWQTNQKKKTSIAEISVDVIDKKAKPIGAKIFYNLPNNIFLNIWIDKPNTNDELALPLSNATTISNNPRLKKSCDGMVGFFYASNNDLQHAGQETLISSSIFTGGNGGGLYITPENLWQVAIVYSVRRLIKQTWLNDRDQFLIPTEPLTEEFKNDCLIWMLFNGSNLTASANDLEWNDKKWSIVNHFIPFTEEEVGANDRFESDFMVRYLANLTPVRVSNPDRGNKPSWASPEAKAVLAEGKKLWQAYFANTDVRAVREELKLNRADVGWYQVRNALKKRNESGDYQPVSFKPFEEAYKTLSEKLQPMVYELGFLRV
ncbi:hypothetical protein [Flavobacterium psychrotolerans]|uniref:Uncharacterized protein n=1 Tax=Flavobacterium psychrotolerans TaxID=2169410 RepID=A0A2U1JN43_9FLAO|nr:hypothetical protein [Flavobacterium psychrotolerans]PWA06425.1 hypothetical protein DB895_03110 [Flavobacterium psychrotolerans]